jgi:hypothetical protein
MNSCKHIVMVCLFGLGLLCSVSLTAQDSPTKPEKPKKEKQGEIAVLFNPYYVALLPVGLLSDRFGFSNDIGMNVTLKTRNNWMIGIEGGYLFGSETKGYTVDSISTSLRSHILQEPTADGTNTGYIIPALSGFIAQLRLSKVIPFTRYNKESGLMLSLAAGFMQHKILINVNPRFYPQFNDVYLSGYDRLCNGAMTSAMLGYFYMSRNHKLSFYIAAEYNIGFTQNRRGWNFDEGGPPRDGTRIDMLGGIRLGWNIPVYMRKAAANRDYY